MAEFRGVALSSRNLERFSYVFLVSGILSVDESDEDVGI